tara:strand:+ start:12720 stop:13229 length:510 start_codon:yes stop_codon:yes gene_type:complete
MNFQDINTEKKYIDGYHNNLLNFHISYMNTKKCSIQDVDCHISSLRTNQQFFIEYKYKQKKLTTAQLLSYNTLITAQYPRFKNTYGYIIMGELPEENLFNKNVRFKPLTVIEMSKNSRLNLNSDEEEFYEKKFEIISAVKLGVFLNIELDYETRMKAVKYENKQTELQL